MALVKHKQALKEIFDAEMLHDGELDNLVDVVLPSSVSKLPSTAEVFILLGNWTASDIRVGFMKAKYRLINQELLIGAVSRDNPEGESVTELNCFEASKKVRTILVNNRILASTSYPSGIAIESTLTTSRIDYAIYEDILCCFDTIFLEMKVKEDL